MFAKLEGTPLEDEAHVLISKAIDGHIQQVRERVAREYVRAQQIRDSDQKLALLGEIYVSLSGALETYPQTSLRPKAQHNLKVIAREIEKLDPDYFKNRDSDTSKAGASTTDGTTP